MTHTNEKGKIMKPTKSAIALALLAAFMPAAFAAQAESAATALTIYSTAKPGALSPEFYRGGGNGQGVAGMCWSGVKLISGRFLGRRGGTTAVLRRRIVLPGGAKPC